MAFPQSDPGGAERPSHNWDHSSIQTEAGTRCARERGTAITEHSHCVGRRQKARLESPGRAEMEGASGLRSAPVWAGAGEGLVLEGLVHKMVTLGLEVGLRSGVINLWELVQGGSNQTYVLGSTHLFHSLPEMLLYPPSSQK